jgi:predicted enzyme related to lactoylglutathione lyase
MPLQYHNIFVTIAASNFTEVVEFYHQLCGQEPTTYLVNVYAEFQFPNLRLGIFKPKKTKLELTNSGDNGLSLCLEVEDLDVAIAYLIKLGYPPPGDIIIASHGREIYAYDPAGNRLIFYQSG